jgi:perosamine synthetase
MGDRFIPVAAPVLGGNEKKYVTDCLESTWISSTGKYLDQFESGFAEFCDAKHAIACCNGTVALHLALAALGVGPGDEVIVPTLTFVATANAVGYCGARPVFVDSEFETWNIDPTRIEAKITPRTKGIIAVHLYGHPADMDAIQEIAARHGLFVIEDAAEAHGARYKGRIVGTLSKAASFSFYGNKIVTTGEGGMVVTNDDALALHLRQLKGQGVDLSRRYWFPIVGYNYRMTNVAAAIGLAQLEKVDWHLARRLEVAAWYKEMLKDVEGISWQSEKEWANHVYWMFTVLLDEKLDVSRDEVMGGLRELGIDTRPVFYPMHTLPPYCEPEGKTSYPVAAKIARRGLNLPTWSGLTRDDVQYVCEGLLECLSAKKVLK